MDITSSQPRYPARWHRDMICSISCITVSELLLIGRATPGQVIHRLLAGDDHFCLGSKHHRPRLRFRYPSSRIPTNSVARQQFRVLSLDETSSISGDPELPTDRYINPSCFRDWQTIHVRHTDTQHAISCAHEVMSGGKDSLFLMADEYRRSLP